ncbi:MAG: L-lactate dehydrogenase [Eubacteriales bacterium]|nr:L-lactate dehydrogenase [Eubacteriales bacterium]
MIHSGKVAVIGCGAVGSSIAFALMQNPYVHELVLLDYKQEKAEGEALDILHGVPFARPTDVYAGKYEDLKDAEVIVISAGVGPKPGQTRFDQMKIHLSILQSILDQLNKVEPEGCILLVSNPVDILTAKTMKVTVLPKNRVFGSGTLLDSARFKTILASHLHANIDDIHGYILGEHGESAFPAWSLTNVEGIPVQALLKASGIEDLEKEEKQILSEVVSSGYDIVKKKGMTCYGIAMSVTHIVESVLTDSKAILPISVLQEEEGIEGVALSLPTVVGKGGAEKVLPVSLSATEKEELLASAKKLREVLTSLDIVF